MMTLFRCRKERLERFGKYHGLPVELLGHEYEDGRQLIACGYQRFSVYPDELVTLAKPLHGPPANWSLDKIDGF